MIVLKKKNARGQWDDYTTGCLLDYDCFKHYYKMVAIDLMRKRSTWCWSKSNTTNYVYKKSKSNWRCKW